MKLDKILDSAHALCAPYRIADGKKFRLKNFDPTDTGPLKREDKPAAKKALKDGVEALSALQEMLYADDKWSLLAVFQAMDAAGKDSSIEHVMSGVNPQGCQVASFKAPSSNELDHDFLWRCTRHLPERGRIGIFNRSYYEEVLVVRVHPQFLKGQKLPARLVGKQLWKERFESIRDYERHLARNGTAIAKFFLNVSREEQKQRFLDRINQPEKNWKFSDRDVVERQHWDKYMAAYEDAIRNTAAPHAPWYVVPADNKWYMRLIVAAALIDTLRGLGLAFPTLGAEQQAELAKAKEHLLNEK